MQTSSTTSAQNTSPNLHINLQDFIAEFGEGLMASLNRSNPPVYTGITESRHVKRQAIMEALKRKPFPAQAEVVQAAVALLVDQNEQAAIINAEMGTGKVRRIGT